MVSDVESFVSLVHHDLAGLSSYLLHSLQRHAERWELVDLREAFGGQDLRKLILGLLRDELLNSPALGGLVEHALTDAGLAESALAKPKLFLDLIAGGLILSY